MGSQKTQGEYNADHMTHLEGLEAVRKRPGMYIGSTDSKGLVHLAYEIVDNSVDEALAGHCTQIDIVLHEDGSVEVTDDGRGIPVDINAKSGLTGVELVMTKLHAGGKFGGSGYQVSGGLHGVGASVVNALSSRTDVHVRRDGALWQMSFQRGAAGTFRGDGPDAAFTAGGSIRKVRAMKRGEKNGTTVRFHPDPAIFLPGASIDPALLAGRAKQTAFLVPGLTIRVTANNTTEVFAFDGGTADMAEHLASDPLLAGPIRLTGRGEFVENVPVLDEAGHLVSTEVTRQVEVDVALRWGTGYDSTTASFVNVVSTPKHGSHVKGFERALLATVRKGYEGTRLLRAGDDPPVLEDTLEGLTAVVAVQVAEPQFLGQTKEELGTAGVLKVVQEVVAEGLRVWMGKNKGKSRAVLEKIANASRARLAARSQREAARRKTALQGASMPAKLVDCRAAGVAGSELFIVEGDSALGSARAGRNSEYQALLPIRGKILNVQRATQSDVLKNTECASIIQVLGAGLGRTFDIEQMRYNRVILMADADSDGSHIRTLLAVLFFKYFRPVIEEGRLYAAMPPLHKIETLGRSKDTVYTYTQAQMEETVAQLEKTGRKVKRPVQRYKGLGEMDAGELWETTMDPTSRSVRRITLDDAQQATDMAELLMGSAVDPRRNFIIANADAVTDIDA